MRHIIRRRELAAAIAIHADKFNWKYVWFGEHHALTEYSHLSAPEVAIGYVAAKTERIHMGTAIMNISQKGYEFVAEIAPQPNELVIPKKHPSAFFGTPLASYLINTGADTLIVTGCSTSGCVRGTVVDGFAYNFRVMVPQDAVFDRSEVSHAVNLFDMSEKYADVMPTDDILNALTALQKTT